MLVDQPDLTASFLGFILDLWLKSDQGIVATQYPEGGGVPALFPRSFFPALQALDGDRGARHIIAREKSAVTLIQSPDELTDLDSPELLERWAPCAADGDAARRGSIQIDSCF